MFYVKAMLLNLSIGSMVKEATYHFNYFDPTVQNEYDHLLLIEKKKENDQFIYINQYLD